MIIPFWLFYGSPVLSSVSFNWLSNMFTEFLFLQFHNFDFLFHSFLVLYQLSQAFISLDILIVFTKASVSESLFICKISLLFIHMIFCFLDQTWFLSDMMLNLYIKSEVLWHFYFENLYFYIESSLSIGIQHHLKAVSGLKLTEKMYQSLHELVYFCFCPWYCF